MTPNTCRLNEGLMSIIESFNITGNQNMTISRQHFNITLRDIDPASFSATEFSNNNISLPSNLLENTPTQGSTVRVAQSTFDNPGLYLARSPELVASGVVDLTVVNATVENLTNPVNITLSQIEVNTPR